MKAIRLEIASAVTLEDLHRATIVALTRSIQTNLAIGSLLTGFNLLRGILGVHGEGRVITQWMMEEYGAIPLLPLDQREVALDRWLLRFGHRGPLESDPANPRFAELREALLADLLAAQISTSPPAHTTARRKGLRDRLLQPLNVVEARRERFRDELMRCWATLRRRILTEGERLVQADLLDAPEDAFWIRAGEFGGDLRAAVARSRAEHARWIELPATARKDELERLASAGPDASPSHSSGEFHGIGLGAIRIEGKVVKAANLLTLLQAAAISPDLLGPGAILVTPSLEPSWGVVFPRVAGVVAEIGGELSHASILLRSAAKPAVVNCAGIYSAVHTGDHLVLDAARGLVAIIPPDLPA